MIKESCNDRNKNNNKKMVITLTLDFSPPLVNLF